MIVGHPTLKPAQRHFANPNSSACSTRTELGLCQRLMKRKLIVHECVKPAGDLQYRNVYMALARSGGYIDRTPVLVVVLMFMPRLPIRNEVLERRQELPRVPVLAMNSGGSLVTCPAGRSFG